MTYFIIGQVFSLITLLIALVTVQMKDLRHILVGEILANVFTAVSYLFLGGLSGAWICIVAAIQTFSFFLMNQWQSAPAMRKTVLWIFASVYLIGTTVIYQDWSDIVSGICAVVYLLSVSQSNGKAYRCIKGLSCVFWIIYDITTLAFVNGIMQGMLLVSIGIGMIRQDRGHS